jgi:L-threonylcarbamoyladenylate synthase
LQTANIKRAVELLDNIDEKIEKFLCNFWPGALTVIGNSSKYLKEQYNWNYETVALRIPDNRFDLAVFENIDEPIMVTSVNISGNDLPENVESMLELFSGKIDFAVVDDNEYKIIPSTIIDITKGFPKIVRQGIIEDKMIFNKWEL